jgi:hypothetical protein
METKTNVKSGRSEIGGVGTGTTLNHNQTVLAKDAVRSGRATYNVYARPDIRAGVERACSALQPAPPLPLSAFLHRWRISIKTTPVV